jgi:phage terminase large subunit
VPSLKELAPHRAGGKRPLLDQAIDSIVAGFLAAAEPVPECDPRYQLDPLAWAEERLGIPRALFEWDLFEEYQGHKWDGTRNPLATVAAALANHENVGVESATGTGKTFLAAVLALWFADCFENSQVVTLAPRERQLERNCWKELKKLFPRFKQLRPNAQLLYLEIRVDPTDPRLAGWKIVGMGCQVRAGEESATALQGEHAPDQLFILEEFPGVHPAIVTAVDNTCTDDHNLILGLGNPDHQQDELHKFCERKSVRHVRVSALDHPNLVCNEKKIPGAVSKKKTEERTDNYGKGSRLYESRIRGICPPEAADALIKWAWCREAANRALYTGDQLRAEGPPALGVDVANSENGDKAAIAEGQGALLERVDTFACPDANLLASEKVKPRMDLLRVASSNVGVDVIGVGVGTFNELKRLGVHVQALNGGVPPMGNSLAENFANLRTQMYWQLRIDLQHGIVGLPEDEELWQDITCPLVIYEANRIRVESKKEIRKRLGRSPDKGDAAVYWNWVRQRRMTITVGGGMVEL